MKKKKLIMTTLALLLGVCFLFAYPLSFTTMQLQGLMPITEVFRVEQSEDALNFNLVDSRNSTVRVGSYTITSNDISSQFHLFINPGEDGKQSQFAFVLDPGFKPEPGQQSSLPITVRVVSNTTGAVSVSGASHVDKSLGVRGSYISNNEILYENGDILAEIPDFNPDMFATGWYSAAIQLSIQVI
ncbi:MAG TPA: hypothetical protein VJ869_13290 [Sphaerochaeta sp.]|nr:hypothetical protein [Sphaerochaeta sp.]